MAQQRTCAAANTAKIKADIRYGLATTKFFTPAALKVGSC